MRGRDGNLSSTCRGLSTLQVLRDGLLGPADLREMERRDGILLRRHNALSAVRYKVAPQNREHLDILSTGQLEVLARLLPDPTLNDVRGWSGMRVWVPGRVGRLSGIRLNAFLASPPWWYRGLSWLEARVGWLRVDRV